ncbi:unnamed protein product [Closterium sp. NIES-54]
MSPEVHAHIRRHGVALPCLSRRPALPVVSPCPACRVALPCLSRRPAAACRVALPCPRVALLAAAPPCPARAEPPCCPHRHAARRPATRAARLLPALLASTLLPTSPPCWQPHCCPHHPARAALLLPVLLRAALLPVRRPAARAPPYWKPHRPALPCPRTALLDAALPCVGRVPLFPSHAPPLPALRASLVLERCPTCVLLCWSCATLLCLLWLLSIFSPLIMRVWLTRDAAARLAIRNHLTLAERAQFGQHKTAKALYDAVDTRYSSPATASLGRLILPYLFPELSTFPTVEDLVTHLRTSDTRYRAALPAEFLDKNPPPMYITLYFIVIHLPDSLHAVRDHFLALHPTDLTVDLLKKHLLAAETSVVAVGAARGTPRTPFLEGCSPSPLAPSYASAVAVDIRSTEDVRAASALSGKRRSNKGKGGKSGGGGSGGGGGGGSGGGRGGAIQRRGFGGGQRQQQQRRSETPTPQQLREWFAQRGASGGSVRCLYVIRTGDRAGQTCGKFHTQHRCFSRLDDAWRVEFGDEAERPRWLELLRSGVDIFALDYNAILAAMYALSVSAEGDCYLCVPPAPGIEAAAQGASESALPRTAPAEALHTFTLDSCASCYFFRDITTLTPLPAPVPVRLDDPSGGPVLARSSTVLLCPAAPSGSLSGLHLPSFSTNLVSTAALQDAMVSTTTPGGQHVLICTCTRTGRHLATFTRRPGSSLYTMTAEPPQVAASLPPLPPSPAPPCLPCVQGRQRAAPHSSSFPPTTAPLQTLHTDVKGEVPDVLIPWIRAVRLLLRERFCEDLPVLRLHSDRGGEFSSDLLRDFCRGEGILQSFTLPASPLQNGVAKRHIGLVMEVARTSMIHAVAPHFLWSFAVWYVAHQLNLRPRVSLPETSPTLHWTGKVSMRLCSGAGPGGAEPEGAEPGGAESEGAEFGGAKPEGAERGGTEPEGAEPWGAESEGAESGGAEPRGTVCAGGPAGASPRQSHRREPLSPQQLHEWFAQRTRIRSGAAGAGGSATGGTGAGGAGAAAPGGARTSGTGAAGAGGVGGTGAGDPGAGGTGAGDFGAGGTGAGGARAGGTGAGGAGASSPGRAGVTAGAGGTGGAGAAGPGGSRTRGNGAAGAGDLGAGGTGAGGAGAGGARAGGTRAGGVGAGCTRAGGAGAGGLGAGAGGAGAGDPGAGGVGAGGAGAGGLGAGGTVQRRPFFVPLQPSPLPPPDSVLCQVLSLPSSTGLPPSILCPPRHQSQPQLQPGSPLPAPSPYAEQTDSLTKRREPESRPASLVRAVRTGRRVSRPRPPPVPSTHIMALGPSSFPLRVPLPSPPASSLPDVPGLGSELARAASPTIPCLLATVVTNPSFESTAASALVAELVAFATACRLDYATSLVAESESDFTPSVGGECALRTDVLEDKQEDFECLVAAVPHLIAMLLALEGVSDAPDVPTSRSYAEAITGPYSSKWQTAMDVEMARWKSTNTYVDVVPSSWANIVDDMWIFRVKWPSGSPPVFKARYVARGFSQRQGVDFFQTFYPTPKMTTLWVLLYVAAQRDYELHSLDFSTTFLQGSLHEEMWLRHPPGFTVSFPADTQWSLRRPVYGLCQAPREWHDTLRTTLVALGFAPSTTDMSLFLHIDTSLLPIYVLVYVDDLVFATADTEALALVKSEL